MTANHPAARARYAVALCLAMHFTLVVTPGCHDSGQDGRQASGPRHVDPPHRPGNFLEAVDRLRDGHDTIREALSSGRLEPLRDEQVPIQHDIARWLPELAADSDMPEAEWDAVNAAAGRLLAVYDAMRADLDAGRLTDLATSVSAADGPLRELETVRDAADPAWFPPVLADEARTEIDDPDAAEVSVEADIPDGPI